MKQNFWIYADNTEQRHTAASLIYFGAEVFKRAKSIKELDSLKNILIGQNVKSSNTNDSDIFEFIHEYLIDCIKFLIFFENYMKAELVINGYCVHTIDYNNPKFKNLAKEQRFRPIKLEEIHKIENFIIDRDNKTIYHNAIKSKTIGIKELLGSDQYKLNYDFDAAVVSIITELNNYRNTLHFKDSLGFELSEELISNLELLNSFVDKTLKRIEI